MNISKKITIFLGVGVIIAVGYYFLRKSKQNVTGEQLSQLNTNTTSSIEQELAPKPTFGTTTGIAVTSGGTRANVYNGTTINSPTRGNTTSTGGRANSSGTRGTSIRR